MCNSWKDKIDGYLITSHDNDEAKEKSYARRRKIQNSAAKTSKADIVGVRLHDERGEIVGEKNVWF